VRVKRQTGFVLLLAGGLLFIVASMRRGSYDSVEGSLKATFSKSERSTRDFWGAARTVGLAVGAVGAVLVIVSGRKA
jgi:hypothetical protein